MRLVYQFKMLMKCRAKDRLLSNFGVPWHCLAVIGVVICVAWVRGQPGEAPPSLKIVIPERESVIRNQYDDAEFICHLTNFPPKTQVTWYFLATNMTSQRIAEGIQTISPRYELSPPEQLDPSSYTFVHNLHISRINMADDGMYQCSAFFNGSLMLPARMYNDSKRLIIRVPVEILANQHHVEAMLNDQALLTWKIIGHPKPPISRFHILLEGHSINRNLERYTILSSNLSKSVMSISLHIAWVKMEDIGLYTLTYVNRMNRVITARILLRELIPSTTTVVNIPETPVAVTTRDPETSAVTEPVPRRSATITTTAVPTTQSKVPHTTDPGTSDPGSKKDWKSRDADGDDEPSWTLGRSLIFAGTGAAIATVVIGVIVSLVLWQRQKRRRKKNRETNIYMDTRHTTHQQQPVRSQINLGYDESAVHRMSRVHKSDDSRYTMLELDRYEFPRQRLRILDEVGQGKFGHIVLGEALNILGDAKWATVAVKMAKDTATDYEKEDIRRELEIMRMYPRHPNVVMLLGCCIKEDPALIIMEYLPHGNLQDYLRKSRPSSSRSLAYGSAAQTGLTAKDLTQFSWQAARGMTHLAAHSIIHRDLAARNILVGINRVCKVADFGLARSVAGTDHYERNSKGPLPVRWMAPETFHDAYYTTKSDVWAYGILLWEVVTLGASPYPGLTAEEVMKFVMSGQVMAKPPHCDDEVYNIMCRCWCSTGDKRPPFTLITGMLEQLLESEEDYIELKDYEESDYLYMASTSKEKC